MPINRTEKGKKHALKTNKQKKKNDGFRDKRPRLYL